MITVTEKYGIDVELSESGVCNYVVCRIDKPQKSKSKGDTSVSYPRLCFYGGLGGALKKIAALMMAEKMADHDIDLGEALKTVKESNDELRRLIDSVTTLSEPQERASQRV